MKKDGQEINNKYEEFLSEDDLKLYFKPNNDLVPGFIQRPKELSNHFFASLIDGIFYSSKEQPTSSSGWDEQAHMKKEEARNYFLKAYSKETVDSLEKQFPFPSKQIEELIKYRVDLKRINPSQIALLLAAQGEVSGSILSRLDCRGFAYALTSLERGSTVMDLQITEKSIQEEDKQRLLYATQYPHIYRKNEDTILNEQYFSAFSAYSTLGYKPAENKILNLSEIIKKAQIGDVIVIGYLETGKGSLPQANYLPLQYRGTKKGNIRLPYVHQFKIIGGGSGEQLSIAQIDGANRDLPMRIMTMKELKEMYNLDLSKSSGIILRNNLTNSP